MQAVLPKFRFCWVDEEGDEPNEDIPDGILMSEPRSLQQLMQDAIEHPDLLSSLLDHHIVCMQYTGVKDKAGTEIYEDYIVAYEGVNYKVERDGACYALSGPGAHFDMGVLKAHNYEVVGNIYENPELLK